jgi:catechol 2,3-dioxygenase-like lactoylglutathione lyase family enzyme
MAAPFTVLQIDHIVLRIADLTRSLAFYVDALGCLHEKTQGDIGLVQLRAGTTLIDLVPLDGLRGRAGGEAAGKTGRNVDHFALEIAPFDEAAIRAHLGKHGIDAGESKRRYGARGFGPSLYLTDPDGNTVELKGPSEPGTRETASPM